MSIAVSSCRYRSRRSDESLRERCVRLGREKPRYGYRRLQVLLEREGERVNHKRVWRVYREAGWSARRFLYQLRCDKLEQKELLDGTWKEAYCGADCELAAAG
jgi:transposase InsO family protein